MRDMSRQADADGVVRVERGRSLRAGLIVGAVLFAVLCVSLALWLSPAADTEALPALPPTAAPPPPSLRPQRRPVVTPPPSALQELPLSGGEKSGLALFQPGTKPIKVGLVVPDGFALPPGYVRHYQTLDDGRQLPAILMFHPDFRPTGEDGAPIEVPPDRIVPPELAPPELQQRWLEVPEPLAEPPPSERGDGE